MSFVFERFLVFWSLSKIITNGIYLCWVHMVVVKPFYCGSILFGLCTCFFLKTTTSSSREAASRGSVFKRKNCKLVFVWHGNMFPQFYAQLLLSLIIWMRYLMDRWSCFRAKVMPWGGNEKLVYIFSVNVEEEVIREVFINSS